MNYFGNLSFNSLKSKLMIPWYLQRHFKIRLMNTIVVLMKWHLLILMESILDCIIMPLSHHHGFLGKPPITKNGVKQSNTIYRTLKRRGFLLRRRREHGEAIKA